MKAIYATAAIASLIGSMAAAQPYGGYGGYDRPGPGYEEGGRGYRDREDRYEERGYGYRERGPRREERGYGFNEREYLRCNPDVRIAIAQGRMPSARFHYESYGRREGRRVSC